MSGSEFSANQWLLDVDQQDVDALLNDLLDGEERKRINSINVVGGVKAAREILKNRPSWCNVYDIMYKDYSFVNSPFMLDHNITVQLSDLEYALSKL